MNITKNSHESREDRKEYLYISWLQLKRAVVEIVTLGRYTTSDVLDYLTGTLDKHECKEK